MKKLICCLCHCHTIGRQWPARDAGFGICTPCADQLRDIVSPEAMRDMYGIRGTHYACSPTEAQCDSLLAEAVAEASQTSELAFQCVRAAHKVACDARHQNPLAAMALLPLLEQSSRITAQLAEIATALEGGAK